MALHAMLEIPLRWMHFRRGSTVVCSGEQFVDDQLDDFSSTATHDPKGQRVSEKFNV
jgi:hypothetical protein